MNKIVIVDPNAYGGHNDFCRSLSLLLSGKDSEVIYVNRESKSDNSPYYKHIAVGYSDQSFKNKIKSYINIFQQLKKLADKGYAIHFQDITPYMIPVVSLLLLLPKNKKNFYLTLHITDTLYNLSLAGFEINQNSSGNMIDFVLPTSDTWYAVFSNEEKIITTQELQVNIELYQNVPSDVPDEELSELGIALYQNYPNPFNPSTTISFETTTLHKNTRIEIYNLKGQKVKSFPINQLTNSPVHQVIWNGTDENNKSVSSGIYFYKLKIDNFEQTKKMILLK